MTLIWNPSELLTGEKFQDKSLIVAFKNGRQSFSGTVSDQFDADLKLTLPQANAIYLVQINYGTTGDPASDITLEWDVTGGATVVRTTQALESGGLSTANANIICREQSTAGWSAGTVTGIPSAVREKLTVSTGTEPCTLGLVWHQNVSNPAVTSIHDYGWAVARRLT